MTYLPFENSVSWRRSHQEWRATELSTSPVERTPVLTRWLKRPKMCNTSHMEKLVQPCRLLHWHPGTNRRVGHHPQKHQTAKLNRNLRQSRPKILSSLLEQRKFPRPFRARQPPSWMKDFASSVLFLTLSRVSMFVLKDIEHCSYTPGH